MELIVLLIGCALLIGLFLRKKGDNTMDTLGKGCGCMFWFVFHNINDTLLFFN